MLDFLSQWPDILNQNEEWFTLLLGARCGEMPFEVKRNEICSVVSDSLQPHGLNSPWNSPGQNTGMDSLSLLQGIFTTQGLNLSLPHCRHILYQLSHKENLRILERVARGSFPTQDLNWGFLHRRWILYRVIREAPT